MCERLFISQVYLRSIFSGDVNHVFQRHHEAINEQNIVLIARSQVGHREDLPLSVLTEASYKSFTSFTHLRISPCALHSSFLCLSNKVNARVREKSRAGTACRGLEKIVSSVRRRGRHASRWPRRLFGAHLTAVNHHCLLLFRCLCIS